MGVSFSNFSLQTRPADWTKRLSQSPAPPTCQNFFPSHIVKMRCPTLRRGLGLSVRSQHADRPSSAGYPGKGKRKGKGPQDNGLPARACDATDLPARRCGCPWGPTNLLLALRLPSLAQNRAAAGLLSRGANGRIRRIIASLRGRAIDLRAC